MIVFYDGIAKTNNPKYRLLLENTALWKLRRFLNAEEPKLVAWLVSLWHNQENAITYKEIREAILTGELSTALLEEWQQDYTKFVKKYMEPMYTAAIEAANQQLREKYPEFYYNPTIEGIQSFTEAQSARFVTNSTMEQVEGIRQVVRRAAALSDMSVDDLSRVIRPMVGLTIQQANANMNYFENLIKHGTSPKRAREASIRYSARQHRFRAYNIARTEMAFAYNEGEHRGILDAQNRGLMGKMIKKWCTADDERVCDICGSLEGKEIGTSEIYTYMKKKVDRKTGAITYVETRINPKLPESYQIHPPAHPGCRCAALYIEVEPPKFGPEFNVSGAAANSF